MATVLSLTPPKDFLVKRTDEFNTAEGTLSFSKPYRQKGSQRMRALVSFTPRTSAFESSGMNEFRGFYSLFWVSIFLWTVRTYITSIETNGAPLNLHFATMFSQDAITLAISDFVLVLSTGLCVPFAMAMSRGWIKYYWTGLVLQHLLQTTILFTAIKWTFNRQWPWVQSGFLTLHSLVMIMKMHSYLAVNGHLQIVSQQSPRLLEKLRKATARVGGWEQALKDATPPEPVTASDGSANSSISGTPDIPEGSTSSYIDVSAASILRKRLAAMASNGDSDQGIQLVEKSGPAGSTYTSTISDISDAPGAKKNDQPRQLPLVFHPDPEISALAREYSDLQAELVSPGPEKVTWPNNITWKNFAVYQLVPTLVYELEYPRTNQIRPLYIFEKTVATFGTFALLYTVTESFILPLTPTSEQSFFRSLLDLALPFMVAYLLLFYIIFECICNGFAELSYFADRQFYDDWVWNSISWDDFSRKWNKPVHTFLLRHVYGPLIYNCGFSKTVAMLFTFFLSASAHELVMVVVTQKFRLYLFVLQIVQVPMILLSRHPIVRRNKQVGNVVFWLGLYAGFPLLCVAYVAY